MSEEIIRTAGMIAAEINTIKEQVRQNLLSGAIEIGKRLIEAKALVPFGSWGSWLEENVDYSERTAQNLMKCFEEYGKKTNPQSIADLSYTKAVALLALPGELRSEVIDRAPEMSVRELKDEIERLKQENADKQITIEDLLGAAKSEDETEKLRGMLETANAEAEKAKADAEAVKNTMNGKLTDAEGKARDADRKAKEAAARAQELEKKVSELESREPEVRTETVEVVPDAMVREMQELKKKLQQAPNEAVIKLRAGYERFSAEFKSVKSLLDEVAEVDLETAGKYRTALKKSLEAMARMLEV